MNLIHLGQALDIFWHNKQIWDIGIPDEEQYLMMVGNKTGVLIRMMVRMIAVFLNLSREVEIAWSLWA